MSNCLGLIENTQAQKPELVFHSKIAVSAQQLQQTVSTATERFEFKEVSFLRNDREDIEQALASDNYPCTPSCLGSLALFLQQVHD